jgi:hypothetical protein
MWYEHDAHVKTPISGFFERANDITVREYIDFQPNRLLRTADGACEYLLAIVWFNVYLYSLYPGAERAVALALRIVTDAR